MQIFGILFLVGAVVYSIYALLPASSTERIQRSCSAIHVAGDAIEAPIRVAFSKDVAGHWQTVTMKTYNGCTQAVWEWAYGREYRAERGFAADTPLEIVLGAEANAEALLPAPGAVSVEPAAPASPGLDPKKP